MRIKFTSYSKWDIYLRLRFFYLKINFCEITLAKSVLLCYNKNRNKIGERE